MTAGTERRRFLIGALGLAASTGLAACTSAKASFEDTSEGTSPSEIKIDIFEKISPESITPSDFFALLQVKDAAYINADRIRATYEDKGYYVFVHSKGEFNGTPLDFQADGEGNLVATNISEWYLDEEMKDLNVKAVNPHFYQNDEGKVAVTVLPIGYGLPVILRQLGTKERFFAGIDSSYNIIHGPFPLFDAPGKMVKRYGYQGDSDQVATVSLEEFGSQLSGNMLVCPLKGESVALKFVGNLPVKLGRGLRDSGQVLHPIDINGLNR